ncbi:YceI family protein [Pontibacter ramchanderi]|uniref:Polyisoprenoid-binding protein YceI n=1 Tax=Pontibacter ramchanderi TaxID=1179743 RepID=A0A2N3UB46_9BACT|nr:YceI family protein [Pontibacter ramchanderi]PKV66604.1 polyisoprenoid-binding protein YceI [Pontibacter ramchanderi]
MKKLVLIVCSLYWLTPLAQAQTGTYKGIGTIVFEAGAPLSLIKGTSEAANGLIDLETGKFRFDVPINSFQFLNSLMHERFNDKYMQSSRFQKATFVGRITEKGPVSAKGEAKVTAAGILTIHGVAQKRTISGTLVQKGNTWQLVTDFPVKLADHHIQAPRLSSGYGASTMNVSLKMPLEPAEPEPQQIIAIKKFSFR